MNGQSHHAVIHNQHGDETFMNVNIQEQVATTMYKRETKGHGTLDGHLAK